MAEELDDKNWDITIALAYENDNQENLVVSSSVERNLIEHYVKCPESVARQSSYLAALLDSGMLESQTRCIHLNHLDPKAVSTVIRFLKDRQTVFEELLRSAFQDSSDMAWVLLAEAFDYLQVVDADTTIHSLLALHGPDGIGMDCVRHGWIEHGRVVSIPSTRKTRQYRFWVCLSLTLQLMPDALTSLDQSAFTSLLEPFAGDSGAVALRRELVDYGLIERKGDGSSCWRPWFTAPMLMEWLRGTPRKVA